MKAAYVGIDMLYPALPALFETGCEIIKIYTCRTDNITEFNTQVVAFAQEHNIPLQINRILEDDLYELLDMGCDFVLVGGYYYVLPVIEKLRMVNIHPAYLPLGRGPWPMPVTILKGLTESGVTLHRVAPQLDTGDIILQAKVPVYPDDNLETLTQRQNAEVPEMVKRLVSDFDNLWNSATPQGDGEYWNMPLEDDYTVRSSDSFEEADLALRAFYGYECYYIDLHKLHTYELIGATAHRGTAPSDTLEHIFPIEGGYISSPKARRV